MYSVSDYLAQPAVPADVRMAYGSADDQFGDLYLPLTPGPHPLVILLHGGCWQQAYGLAPLGMLCADLRTHGVAVWSLEYRRLGGAGGWPMTLLDVAAGVDYVRELAQQFPLDLTQVATVGHSAGGHLALWAAARSKLPPASPLFMADPLPIRAVIALAALADLSAGAAAQLCGSACSDLVEGVPERYTWASPAALLPLGVPHHHLVGIHDPIVPAEYVAQFVAAAQQAGDQTHLTVLPDAGHFEVTAHDTPAWAQVRAILLDLWLRS